MTGSFSRIRQSSQQEGASVTKCRYFDTIILDDPTIIELDDDALLFDGELKETDFVLYVLTSAVSDYDYEDDFGDDYDYEEVIYEEGANLIKNTFQSCSLNPADIFPTNISC